MDAPNPFGDVFKKIERQARRAKTQIKGRAAAQRVLDAYFAGTPGQAAVASVKTGVVTLEVSSSALFQEIEGFHKQHLLDKMREAGMPVREVRARLKGSG